MKSRTSICLLLSSALFAAALPAQAHHGWSWYGDEPFTLTATVVEKHFGNPHDRMIVEAAGQKWNLLLSPPSRSKRAGFTADNVDVGDVITAHGHRRSEGDNFEMKTERLEVDGKLYNLYPDRS